VLRDKLQHVLARMEALLAVANFGASSTFWLITAFLVSVDDYGRLMTLQAAVLMLVAAFTLRTYDLVYFLTTSHRVPLRRAWHAGLAMEGTASLLCLALGLAAIFVIAPGRFPDPVGSAVFLALATAIVGQQSSIARLRRERRVIVVKVADSITLVLWAGAVLYLLLGLPRDREQLLILGAIPQATRTVIILAGALALRPRDPAGATEAQAPIAWPAVVRFVVGGQAVNFIKNGATSIETSILAAFIAPAPVALYRLSKSTQGIIGAFSNVAFQQGTDAMSQARDPAQRSALLGRLRAQGLRGSLAAYPLSMIFALVYAYVKPGVSGIEFQLVMAFSFLAFLPQVLLQGAFIVISLAGRQTSINLIYLVSTAVLVALSSALFVFPSIWLFLATLTIANGARLVMLERTARRVLPALGTGTVDQSSASALDQPEDAAEPAFGASAR
jgi:Flp pilus assembly pilin Flp